MFKTLICPPPPFVMQCRSIYLFIHSLSFLPAVTWGCLSPELIQKVSFICQLLYWVCAVIRRTLHGKHSWSSTGNIARMARTQVIFAAVCSPHVICWIHLLCGLCCINTNAKARRLSMCCREMTPWVEPMLIYILGVHVKMSSLCFICRRLAVDDRFLNVYFGRSMDIFCSNVYGGFLFIIIIIYFIV